MLTLERDSSILRKALKKGVKFAIKVENKISKIEKICLTLYRHNDII